MSITRLLAPECGSRRRPSPTDRSSAAADGALAPDVACHEVEELPGEGHHIPLVETPGAKLAVDGASQSGDRFWIAGAGGGVGGALKNSKNLRNTGRK